MPKVTSKLQLTVPKAVADIYGIRPGDELEWIPAGEVIRVVLAGRRQRAGKGLTPEERVELFDRATERQRRREAHLRRKDATPARTKADRGWRREELYKRGLPS
jgi:bifunctional DNA-binding transcriptional regulator/antitoxin component of YhaV-PrlF toxin-antitoxin module